MSSRKNSMIRQVALQLLQADAGWNYSLQVSRICGQYQMDIASIAEYDAKVEKSARDLREAVEFQSSLNSDDSVDLSDTGNETQQNENYAQPCMVKWPCSSWFFRLQLQKPFWRDSGFLEDGAQCTFWHFFARVVGDNRSASRNRMKPDFVATLRLTIKYKSGTAQFSNQF